MSYSQEMHEQAEKKLVVAVECRDRKAVAQLYNELMSSPFPVSGDRMLAVIALLHGRHEPEMQACVTRLIAPGTTSVTSTANLLRLWLAPGANDTAQMSLKLNGITSDRWYEICYTILQHAVIDVGQIAAEDLLARGRAIADAISESDLRARELVQFTADAVNAAREVREHRIAYSNH